MASILHSQQYASDATATTTKTFTFAQAATAGNLIAFLFGGDKDVGTLSVDPAVTSGWTIEQYHHSASVSGAIIWKKAAGGETQIKIDWTVSHVFDGVFVEVAGITNPTVDVSVKNPADNSDPALASAWSSGTTAATGATGTALAAFFVDTGTNWPATGNTYSNSFTEIQMERGNGAAGAPGCAVAWKDAIASGSAVECTLTQGAGNTADNNAGMVAVFRSAPTGPAYEQNSSRARNDDGSESAATWKAAANTNWTQAVDQNFRLRFLVKNSTAVPVQNTVFQLRYSKNGGAYTDVTAASLVARATASPNVTDGAALTEQMGGAGAYNPGTFDGADGAATCYTSAPTLADHTEAEFCARLRGVDLANSDTVDFRLYSGGSAIATYTNTPRATASGAATGTASKAQSGAMTSDGFKVRAVFSGTTNVRLAASTSSDLSSPSYSPSVAVDTNGLAQCTITGLQPYTLYYFGWELDGALTGAGGGTCKTALGSAGNFVFTAASCADALVAQNPASMTAMTTRSEQADFFIMLGDEDYWDINLTTPANYRTARNTTLGYPTRAAFYAKYGTVFILSDHDYCGNNTDGTATGRDASVQVWREYVPYYPLHETATNGATYQEPFLYGRCVFIPLDTRTRRDPWTNADSSTKTMLGATQKAWLKNVWLTYPNHVKFVLGDGPWLAGPVDPTVAYTADEDHWGAYRYERKELVDFCAANNIKNNIYVAGDMHAVAADDGRTQAGGIYSAGNWPIFQCAPLARDSSLKGSTANYLYGPFPATAGINSFQYGHVTVADGGGYSIDVTFRGYDSTNAALLTQLTLSFPVPADLPGTGSPNTKVSRRNVRYALA